MALPMPCNPCIPDTIMLIVISLPATDLLMGASATNHIESPFQNVSNMYNMYISGEDNK